MKRVIMASTTSNKIVSNRWVDIVHQLDDMGYKVDSINRGNYSKFIYAYSGNQEYEIEVTKYNDGTYEVMLDNISKIYNSNFNEGD